MMARLWEVQEEEEKLRRAPWFRAEATWVGEAGGTGLGCR